MRTDLTGGPAPAATTRQEAPQAITVTGLRKDYGAVRAVRDVTFSVARERRTRWSGHGEWLAARFRA